MAVVLFLNSCSSLEVYKEPPLEYQILKFRSGYKSLTHRACSEYKSDGECLKYSVKEYDLAKEDVRTLLSDLGFICKIASKRYKILKKDPLFATDQYYRCGFLKLKKCRDRNTLSVNRVDYFLQANTKCFSYKRYSFDTF